MSLQRGLGSAIAAVLLIMTFATVQAVGQSTGGPISIGVSAPLTAQFAQDGVWMKQGIDLAVKEINAAGGIRGRQVQVFYEDDQGPNPTAAVNAVNKLITLDHAVAVIGPHFTPAMLPSEPVFAKYNVPALTGATGAVISNNWIFRMRLNDRIGAKLLVAYVLDTLHWKKIGLDYVNTAFGQTGIKYVQEALSARDVTPVAVQTHLDSTMDFTSQLLTFQKAGVDGIIVWTDDQPGGLIMKQMATLGVKFKLAGSTTFSQPPLLKIAGSAANGAIAISDFVPGNPAPSIQAWKKKYSAVYGADPELYASTYYDAMNVLGAALRKAGAIDGPAIQKALGTTKSFRGVMTTYTYNPSGDMVHSGLITLVVDQQSTVVTVEHE